MATCASWSPSLSCSAAEKYLRNIAQPTGSPLALRCFRKRRLYLSCTSTGFMMLPWCRKEMTWFILISSHSSSNPSSFRSCKEKSSSTNESTIEYPAPTDQASTWILEPSPSTTCSPKPFSRHNRRPGSPLNFSNTGAKPQRSSSIFLLEWCLTGGDDEIEEGRLPLPKLASFSRSPNIMCVSNGPMISGLSSFDTGMHGPRWKTLLFR
mmetsp:Transcript_130269/g.259843  ORF Transcript_130269/g.259843 Transcript_130269/m.259843 type:complete len:209 (-) Transcript_130269:125-751(-)